MIKGGLGGNFLGGGESRARNPTQTTRRAGDTHHHVHRERVATHTTTAANAAFTKRLRHNPHGMRIGPEGEAVSSELIEPEKKSV